MATSDFAGLASSLFDDAPDSIVVADSEGRYVRANKAAGELFGLSPEELIGRSIAEFAPAEIQTAEVFSTFLAQGAMRGEFTIVRPDGSLRHVEYNARSDVQPGLHMSILRDVTDRERLVEKLRESEEQFYRAFMANLVPMAIRTVEGGQFVAANEAFLQLTGYYRSELVGASVESLGLAAEAGSFEQIQSLLLEHGTIDSRELKIRRKDTVVVSCIASFSSFELRAGPRVLIAVNRVL